MKKQERGITLVALLITIVVLVILAVVAITEINDNNIIEYANAAANKFEKEQENEKTVIDKYEEYLNGTHKCNFNKQVASARYRISQEVKDYCTYYYSCSCGKSSETATFVYHDPAAIELPPDWGYDWCSDCRTMIEWVDEYGNSVWDNL